MKETPNMPQMLFANYLMKPIPFPPRDSSGVEMAPNGETILSLEDASEAFGMTTDCLKSRYCDVMGDILSDEDAKLLGAYLPASADGPAERVTIRHRDIHTLREMYPGLKDEHMAMLVAMANRRGLDPLVGQIIPKYTKEPGHAALRFTIISKIEAFRVVAARTKRYVGPSNTKWLCTDGKWKDVWDGVEFPVAAKAGVYIKGRTRPIEAVARWESYVQYEMSEQDDGRAMSWAWRTMGDTMIEKCAEAKALRKAFPEDLGGLYTNDEMGQADNPPPPTPERREDDEPSDEAQFLLDEETGEVLEHAPAQLTELELRTKLTDLGADGTRQDLLIDMFKRKMWTLFRSKPAVFYAAVFDKVRENPAMFRLKVG